MMNAYFYVRLLGSESKAAKFLLYTFWLAVLDKCLFIYDFFVSFVILVYCKIKFNPIFHPLQSEYIDAYFPISKYHVFRWGGHEIYPMDYYVSSLSEILSFSSNFSFDNVYTLCAYIIYGTIIPFSYTHMFISWPVLVNIPDVILREDFFILMANHYTLFSLVIIILFGGVFRDLVLILLEERKNNKNAKRLLLICL